MAFKDLSQSELAQVAEFFAVDTASDNPSKKELLAALAAGPEPVTWEQYKTIYLPTVNKEEPKQEEEVKEDVKEEKAETTELPVVLKMERPNGRFDIRGYTFTKEHPFRPVTEEDADWIVTHEFGFRRATTEEVADYYS